MLPPVPGLPNLRPIQWSAIAAACRMTRESIKLRVARSVMALGKIKKALTRQLSRLSPQSYEAQARRLLRQSRP
jgi:hypothetical protein